MPMPARRPPSQVERARVFGERIRALRRERKVTQRDLAEQIPMSAGHLSRIETGDYGPPSDEVIERLAETLATDRSELLRLAGRDPGRRTFEEDILTELKEIRRELTRLSDSLEQPKDPGGT
jgi:transcriptional regulator with XRE-family HTH domain